MQKGTLGRVRIELLTALDRMASVSPITHFFMGWAVANAVSSLNPRERAEFVNQ